MKGFVSEVTLVLCRCKVKHESLVLSNRWIKPNFRDDDDDDHDDNDDYYCYYYNICVTILNLNL